MQSSSIINTTYQTHITSPKTTPIFLPYNTSGPVYLPQATSLSLTSPKPLHTLPYISPETSHLSSPPPHPSIPVPASQAPLALPLPPVQPDKRCTRSQVKNQK